MRKKIKKLMLLPLILLMMVSLSQAAKIGILSELIRPDTVDVAGNHLYVAQDCQFLVYSLEKLELRSKFGKEGEGPFELLRHSNSFPNSIKVIGDKILAESFDKVVIYSKDCKPIKESKKKIMGLYCVLPVGENYVALKSSRENNKMVYVLSLYNAGFDVIKEIHRQECPKRRKELLMLNDRINFSVYKDRIYVDKSEDGFVIDVLDSKGEKLYEIKKDYKKIEISDQAKKEMLEALKDDNSIQRILIYAKGWDNFIKQSTFAYPSAYPAIKDILVSSDKIYVSTFEKQKGKEKYIIMDLKGNIIKTVYLPIPKSIPHLLRTSGNRMRFFGIANDNYYYLVEDEDNENWEIHVEAIK